MNHEGYLQSSFCTLSEYLDHMCIYDKPFHF